MSKLESAEDVIELIKTGKYANRTNAQRGVGRTRLSKNEKEKVFQFINKYFPEEGAPTKASAQSESKVIKRLGKKAKKVAKKPGRKPRLAGSEAPETTEAVERAPRKKTRGTLPISPNEVESVADILQVVDSTVQHSVSVLNALRMADEVSKSGDITAGVQQVKMTLEGAARLLHNNVVVPLANSQMQSDPAVAARLEAVVTASEANSVAYPTQPQPSVAG